MFLIIAMCALAGDPALGPATAFKDLGVPPISEPPMPDLRNAVDYLQWYRDQLAFAAADNAYEDYRLFIEGGLQPDLPDERQRIMTSLLLVPRRWHEGQQHEFAEWIASMPLATRAYEDGSARKFFAHGLIGKPARLVDVQLPGVMLGRLMSEVTLVQTWRMDTHLTLDQFVDRILRINRFANHLAQGATLIEQITAMSIKNRLYTHLSFFVKIVPKDKPPYERLLQTLQKEDSIPVQAWVARALPMEEAMLFDLVQSQCRDAQGKLQPKFAMHTDAVNTWKYLAEQYGSPLQDEDIAACDPLVVMKDLRQYMQAAGRIIASEGVGQQALEAVAKLRASVAGRGKLQALLAPNLERALATALRTELGRRGTQVLVALSIKRKELDAWPASLDALGSLLPYATVQDVCSGRPFVYQVQTPQRMKLYSVGRDARDDNGHQRGMRYGGRDGEDMVIYPPVVKGAGPNAVMNPASVP